MSSLTLKGGKSSEQSPNAPASSTVPLTSAAPDASSSTHLTNSFILHFASGVG